MTETADGHEQLASVAKAISAMAAGPRWARYACRRCGKEWNVYGSSAGLFIQRGAPGRRPIYCSGACRQAAYRARKAARRAADREAIARLPGGRLPDLDIGDI